MFAFGRIAVLGVLLCAVAPSAETAEKLTIDSLPAHSSIGFLGDSITQGVTLAWDKSGGHSWRDEMNRDEVKLDQGGLYHQVVQLFLATRYPGKDLWTVNLGHAGGKASHGLERMSYDVLPFLPDVTLLHFGMNDFGSLGYLNPDKPPGTASKQKRRDEFTRNMTKLIEQLREAGSQVVMMSPTIYDEFVDKKVKPGHGAQAELAEYGTISRGLAEEFGLPFIDLYTPMLAMTQQYQADNKRWSLTKDRVHPSFGGGGDELMAFHILTALGASGTVYEVRIAKGAAEVATNAQVSDVATSATGVRFSLTEHALPYPVLPGDAGFAKLLPFVDELNRQIVAVADLAPGTYDVLIDDVAVGSYSAEELTAGVNLGANTKTPQHQQALAVRDTVLFRKAVLEQFVRVMRNNCRFSLKQDKDIDWDDPESVLAGIDRFRAASEKSGKKIRGWRGYVLGTGAYALQHKQAILDELAAIRAQLAAMPSSYEHRYELRRQ
ncbi:MAG: GDSL-type esterase/lipase family protein [Planctomycetota bacterium]|nr:GDSL-type esterase/lipase family protein [Planctomycetota bacterium]